MAYLGKRIWDESVSRVKITFESTLVISDESDRFLQVPEFWVERVIIIDAKLSFIQLQFCSDMGFMDIIKSHEFLWNVVAEDLIELVYEDPAYLVSVLNLDVVEKLLSSQTALT